MKIGYARVSTHDQNLNLQKDALEKAGCEKIYVDEISGTVAKREGLEKAKEILRKGDVLIVWRLDRLGRSIRDLIDWVTRQKMASALRVCRNQLIRPHRVVNSSFTSSPP